MLHQRGCTVTVDCTWCTRHAENLDHLLCTYYVSSLLWSWINAILGTRASFGGVQDLISYLRNVGADEDVSKAYAQCVLMYTAWELWKARNVRVFQGKTVALREILFMAFQQAEERFAGMHLILALLTGALDSALRRSANPSFSLGSSHNMAGLRLISMGLLI